MRHARPGPGLEARQFLERDVQLDRAAGLRDRLDAGCASAGSACVAQQRSVARGIGVGDDARCLDPLAALELDADAGDDPGDRNARQDDRARSRAMSQRMNETMPIPPTT